MALLTLPEPQPSYGTSADTTFKVANIPFGDGYTQRVPLGLNSVRRTWNAIWENRDNADIERIAAFLRDTGGATAFLWTPPGDTAPSKWIVNSFKGPNYLAGGRVANLTAVFTEVFDL